MPFLPPQVSFPMDENTKFVGAAGVCIDALSSLFLRFLSDGPRLFLFSSGDGGRILRRFLFCSLHILFSILSLLLSRLASFVPPSPPLPRTSAPPLPLPSTADSTSAGRALSRVLSAVSLVPVASRKYDLVRSIAERILDGNLVGGSDELQELNRASLAAAFSRSIVLLEAAVEAEASPASVDGGKIMEALGALRSRVRRWAAPAGDGRFGASAEKLAAETLWLGQKMAESGAASEAVASWGLASRLGALAISAEPRLQVGLVRVCVFMFKHTNSKELERDDGKDTTTSRLPMLKTWLPLLCHACCGVDSSILSIREKADMVSILEEMIEKLTWEEQEDVLSQWLHHFICADSDWPNLESCYMRWYSESRKLPLK
ncbi:hypothetical protein ZIOFF_019208 [Zingiber officinale]|uniref:Uncharacterized protein n=2 Tax=Zingiber officinale TaxID=94328 RepID=A0A8J5LMR0_ZINOF|nr:hypothetical protein ZIOFF_019208 [Zingiber officinale]